MNVKIQGGGNGTYANTGSCVAVTNYLQHEDLERMKKGEEVQPFFNQFRDYVSSREVTFKIDNNKAKLSQTDAKFYVITVSPSEKELRCMGRTPQERAEALQWYIRQDVMRNYAEGFGKGLRSDDVEYYAKIHFNRDGDSDSDMHAHIIVSRKDRSNTKKLSPKTNHTGKKNCGNVKGGFDRTDFFRKCESSFDRRMGFDREPEESFDYLNAVKNGSPAEIARQVERAERIRKEKWDNLKAEFSERSRAISRSCSSLLASAFAFSSAAWAISSGAGSCLAVCSRTVWRSRRTASVSSLCCSMIFADCSSRPATFSNGERSNASPRRSNPVLWK